MLDRMAHSETSEHAPDLFGLTPVSTNCQYWYCAGCNGFGVVRGHRCFDCAGRGFSPMISQRGRAADHEVFRGHTDLIEGKVAEAEARRERDNRRGDMLHAIGAFIVLALLVASALSLRNW